MIYSLKSASVFKYTNTANKLGLFIHLHYNLNNFSTIFFLILFDN